MENVEIARVFEEIADLLEIRGANEFRVRAYRNGAQTIEDMSRPLAEMVREDEDLQEISGIGEDLSGYIRELVKTGHLDLLDEVREQVPAGLAEVVRLDGVGPKRAKKLYDELEVTSVAALEEALDEEKVQELKGFGAKTAEKIRQSIEDHRERLGRVRLSDADQLVRPLLEHMRKAPGLEKIDVAGSYRRRKETVGDIDLLAVAEEAEPLMEHFTGFDQVERVESAGETKGTVILRSDLQVDLRILPSRSYGAALHYFTGSKSHNVEVRERGVRRGLRINEYGVFEIPDDVDPEEMDKEEGNRTGGQEEQDVFDAVGLDWIPPELRENRGEVAAAVNGELPELITVDDIRGDLQMHSDWSDGDATIEEMARACAERGYEYLAITDHSQRVSVTQGLDEEALEEQWEEIEEVQERLGDEIRLLRSLEVDILEDGSLDLDDEHLQELDLVVASVHSYMDLSKRRQTERIIEAISHPEVDILAHPTGRRINEREPYELDMEAVLEAAREHGVAVEINSNPARLDLNDRHAFRAREIGVDLVISTDAHSGGNLELIRYGVDQARRAWLEPRHVINTRSLSDFEEWLRR